MDKDTASKYDPHCPECVRRVVDNPQREFMALCHHRCPDRDGRGKHK